MTSMIDLIYVEFLDRTIVNKFQVSKLSNLKIMHKGVSSVDQDI